jgi:hypothetical protein
VNPSPQEEKVSNRCAHRTTLGTAFLAVSLILLTASSPWAGDIQRVRGQTIYTPAYSHIFIGDREHPFNLTVTLSVRNTDPETPITVESVDYHDSNGKKLRPYLSEPAALDPLAAQHYVVDESDTSGGAGAAFMVRWRSEKPVCPPIVETVMIGTRSQQGISFVSRGQAIQEAR